MYQILILAYVIYYYHLFSHQTHESFLGEKPSGLSLAYKFVMAYISPNLYPQKTNGQRGHMK